MAILRDDTAFERRLKNCPRAGSGVNDYIYHSFLCAAELGVDINEACERVRLATANCGREVPDREIDVQAERAYEWISVCPGTHRSKNSKWPSVNTSLQEEIYKRETPRLITLNENLWAGITPKDMLFHLFPNNPFLCCGKNVDEFTTRRLSEHGGLENYQLVVPSAMIRVQGEKKKRGKNGEALYSQHTLDNTGTRMYLIIEFDDTVPDRPHQHLIIDELASRAPLCVVVYSGSKSYHAWFNCQHSTEDQVWNFMSYAVSLGADKKLWLRSQFVRMPNGFRPNTNRHQSVVYFDRMRAYE